MPVKGRSGLPTGRYEVDGLEPIPPRFWWLKRITVGIVILLIPVAVVRWGWGVAASRALEAELTRYEALRRQLLPGDFDRPQVPDDQNAAVLIKYAIEAITMGPNEVVLLRDTVEGITTTSDIDLKASQILDANRRAIDWVREARRRGACDWGSYGPYGKPGGALRNVQGSVYVFAELAVRHHRESRDDLAVEDLRDLVFLGKALHLRGPLLWSLWGTRFCMIACDVVERIGPTIQISPSSPGASGSSCAAQSSQVMALMADLLDDKPLQDGFVRSFWHEGLGVFSRIQGDLDGPFAGDSPLVFPPFIVAFRPMYDLDCVRILKGYASLTLAAAQPDLFSMNRKSPFQPYRPLGRWDIRTSAQSLSAFVLPSFSGTLYGHLRDCTVLRMAATALAMQLYAAQHVRFPFILAELVPEYLVAIPLDPLVEDGSEVKYVVTNGFSYLYCGPLESGYPAAKTFFVGGDRQEYLNRRSSQSTRLK